MVFYKWDILLHSAGFMNIFHELKSLDAETYTGSGCYIKNQQIIFEVLEKN